MKVRVTFDLSIEDRRRIALEQGGDGKKPAPRKDVLDYVVGAVLGQMETLPDLDDEKEDDDA